LRVEGTEYVDELEAVKEGAEALALGERPGRREGRGENGEGRRG
jgi:hypothetical protein